jgi:hypothetical protein
MIRLGNVIGLATQVTCTPLHIPRCRRRAEPAGSRRCGSMSTEEAGNFSINQSGGARRRAGAQRTQSGARSSNRGAEFYPEENEIGIWTIHGAQLCPAWPPSSSSSRDRSTAQHHHNFSLRLPSTSQSLTAGPAGQASCAAFCGRTPWATGRGGR